MANDKERAGFLSRWSRRKAEVRAGRVSEGEKAQQTQQTLPNATGRVDAQAQPMSVALASAPPDEPALDAPPVPTMDDVQQLTPASDYRAFMSQNVAPDVKNAAMKKLFADPHFNVMDRMDIYIDDYSQADPLPAAMLQKMASAQFMRLVPEAGADTTQAHAEPIEGRVSGSHDAPHAAPDDAPDDAPPAVHPPAADAGDQGIAG